MESNGTNYSRERIRSLEQKQEYTEGQINDIAQDNRSINKTMHEMYTAVKVIEAWVKSLGGK